MECRNCGSIDHKEEILDTGKHYAKLVCTVCNRWVAWVPKPKNKDVRRKSSKYTAERLGYDYCQICRRKRITLMNGQALEVHHIDHVWTNDTKENILVLCTFCHKQVHSYAHYLSDKEVQL